MLMDILGVLIGFASIMLLFSLLVTALVHGTQAALNLRFKNMQNVLDAFFEQLAVLDEPCKSKLSEKIRSRSPLHLYATALPINILGNSFNLTSIGKKELADLVHSIPEMTIEHKELLKQKIDEHFSMIEELMRQRFKQWMHQISIAIAFALCIVFKLNCFTVLNNLNQDSLYRQQAIYASQQLTPDMQNAAIQTQMMALNFRIEPESWMDYYLSLSTPSVFNWFGILFSTILISLGAPFWFNRLQDLVSFRDKLSPPTAK